MDHATKEERPTAPATPVPPPVIEKREEQSSADRSLDLERIRRENEEADLARQQKINEQKQRLANSTEGEEEGIKPLRTLQGDLAEALKNQQISPEEMKKTNKKAFPWF